MGTPIQGRVEILPDASCHRNWDNFRPDGPQLAHMQTLPLPFNLAQSGTEVPVAI